MIRSRTPRRRFALGFTAALVATGFVLALGGTPRAIAKGGKDAHLRYAKTYQAAIEEARARNAHVFVTFHKDK